MMDWGKPSTTGTDYDKITLAYVMHTLPVYTLHTSVHEYIIQH